MTSLSCAPTLLALWGPGYKCHLRPYTPSLSVPLFPITSQIPE